MELCTSHNTAWNLVNHRLFTSNHTQLPWKTSIPVKRPSFRRTNPGLLFYTSSSLRSTSGKTSSGRNQYLREESGVVVEVVEKNPNDEISKEEVVGKGSAMDGQVQSFEFLDKLGIKLDYEESGDISSILLLGGGALVAAWLATAVAGAIDAIPLFPKLMEVVGLGYTLWFTTRYVLFKKNREELVAKVEEIKQQVLGSKVDD